MDFDLIKQAMTFAHAAHDGQARKLEGGPYIQHPFRVAGLVTTIKDWAPVHVAAALLHDVVEDTPVKIDEIELRFGIEVGQIVWELTDTPRLPNENRARHKARELLFWVDKSEWAQNIKCCDVIDNSESIVRLDKDFAVVYCKEISRMLDVFRLADENILKRAYKSIEI